MIQFQAADLKQREQSEDRRRDGGHRQREPEYTPVQRNILEPAERARRQLRQQPERRHRQKQPQRAARQANQQALT